MEYFKITGIDKRTKMYKQLKKDFNNLAEHKLKEAKAISKFLNIASDNTLTDNEKIQKMYHLNEIEHILTFKTGKLKNNGGYWCELYNTDYPELKKLSLIRVKQ